MFHWLRVLMIRMLVMGRWVCGLEVVGIAYHSFPGVVWTENACTGDSYWYSREMEYVCFAMGKAESVFLVGVECRLGGWRGRGCWVVGRDLLVLCESRVSAWLWRCAVSLVILWSRAALTVLWSRAALTVLWRCAVSLSILWRCPSRYRDVSFC